MTQRDHATTLSQLREFVAERDWQRFHTPAGLAKSISIEAAELLEHFQWDESASVEAVATSEAVRDELADVLTYCFMMADRMGWDVDEIVQAKLVKSARKHPVPAALSECEGEVRVR
ncbi:MAG: nucleotide pyrophosphohydrolase [Micrococcus sp.]|nr:nucleotide pyrophosphohydrolase [Micrococcus sp.]